MSRYVVKGEMSLALAAILDKGPGTCQNLTGYDKHCLLKAAVQVSVLMLSTVVCTDVMGCSAT